MNSKGDNSNQEQICAFLLDAANYPYNVAEIKHHQTHISHVFVAGEYTYKIKRPRKLDFLDFSTLEKRKLCCEREIELNSRFAPEIYLTVEPISQSGGKLVFGRHGTVVEYAVKMRTFDEGTLFSEMLERGELKPSYLEEVVRKVAKFHADAEQKPEYWSADAVSDVTETNFSVCDEFAPAVVDEKTLAEISAATRESILKNQTLIESRRKSFVKALHGDLHLGNICLFQGEPTPFDGIEFNEKYACCDVWADIAFLLMDLGEKGEDKLRTLVLNTYLEETDDFEGIELISLYESYRAAVRAKVACLRLSTDSGMREKEEIRREANEYLSYGLSVFMEGAPEIIAVGGFSGTGKTTISREIASKTGAVMVRSDAVRKHLVGCSLFEKAGADAYSREVSHKVYDGLLSRAEIVVDSGRTVILDATYLTKEERSEAEKLAEKKGVSFTGVWCELDEESLKERLSKRTGDVSDADWGVYLKQKEKFSGEIDWNVIEGRAENAASLFPFDDRSPV